MEWLLAITVVVLLTAFVSAMFVSIRPINGVSGIRPGGSVDRIKNTILSF